MHQTGWTALIAHLILDSQRPPALRMALARPHPTGGPEGAAAGGGHP